MFTNVTSTMNTSVNEKDTERCSEIVKTLASQKKPMMVVELKKQIKADWNTIRTNLMKLEKGGRIHTQYIGGNKYYVLNGKSKFQDHIEISDSEYLWIDIFEPTIDLKEHFVRIKQTKRRDIDHWEPMGSITLQKNKIDELISKLNNLKETLRKEYAQVNK